MRKFHYTEDILCFVIYKGDYQWYLSSRGLWELDFEKVRQAYLKAGFPLEGNWLPEERQDTYILNSHNAHLFLQQIEQYKVDVVELRTALREARNSTTDTWFYNFLPSLYIDFDKKILYNLYSEGGGFEFCAPDGWKAEYIDFLQYVPAPYRYWLDSENNINLLEKD